LEFAEGDVKAGCMSEVQVRVEPEARDHIQQRRNGPVNDMFEELDQLAMEDQVVIANEQDLHNNNNGNNYYHHQNEEIVNRVDAELLLYKWEQHLPLQKEDGSFNNPLEWWRLKQQQYPLSAKVALRLLAIPATSVPSERVFSIAGITIAKERSKLNPANAGDLVFIHDAVPALKRYENCLQVLRV